MGSMYILRMDCHIGLINSKGFDFSNEKSECSRALSSLWLGCLPLLVVRCRPPDIDGSGSHWRVRTALARRRHGARARVDGGVLLEAAGGVRGAVFAQRRARRSGGRVVVGSDAIRVDEVAGGGGRGRWVGGWRGGAVVEWDCGRRRRGRCSGLVRDRDERVHVFLHPGMVRDLVYFQSEKKIQKSKLLIFFKSREKRWCTLAGEFCFLSDANDFFFLSLLETKIGNHE